MSPWWLRPTAEDQPEESRDTPPAESDSSASPPDVADAAPAPAARAEAPPDDQPLTPWAAAAGAPAELPEDEEEFEDEEDDDEESAAQPGEAPGAGEPERPAGTAGRRRRRGGRRRGKSAALAAPASEPAEEFVPGARPAPAPARPRRSERSERLERERPEVAELPPVDLARLTREIYLPAPERPAQVEERKIALFCDLENVALGVRDSEIKKFDIDLVLERLLEKGKIIVKKAYADWERYSDYKRPFHEAAIELIDIPQKFYSGKNSADIKMVVDAMDLCYAKEHLDTFVLLSGDSDFSPLVSKLKENNKYVIGVGVKNSSSSLLIDNCDEFLYYEDVWREQHKAPQTHDVGEGLTKKQAECFALMIDAMSALTRENKDVLWGSMIKQTMKRKKPSFNEGYYGYSTFSELLEDAERNGVIKLKKDQRSGSYIVTGYAARR